MPRSVDCLKTPSISGDFIAITQGDVGNKIPIATLLDGGVAAFAAGMWPEPIGRGAGCILQRSRRWRMVAVSVGNQNMGHPLDRQASQQRLDMLGEVGSGIDHRHLAIANDVGTGTLEGKGARI